MKEYFDILARSSLFSGIPSTDIIALLHCVQARCVSYKKDAMIIEEGEQVKEFGIVLSGHGRSMKWDGSDKLVILTLFKAGSAIGVLLAANPSHESSVFVQALEDTVVLHISFDKMLSRCSENCPRHDAILKNYIKIVSQKGLVLHERISCLLKPTVREKITSYLKRVSVEQKSKTITIPLNRNQMAEYLNVERSALSRELSMMKREGLIDYHLNGFKLIH